MPFLVCEKLYCCDFLGHHKCDNCPTLHRDYINWLISVILLIKTRNKISSESDTLVVWCGGMVKSGVVFGVTGRTKPY